MATATMSLAGFNFNIEYHQTMKTTEEARVKVARAQAHALQGHVRFVAEALLYFPFFALTRDTKKLVSLLNEFETYPSSILLEEDVEKMPEDLQELFRKMCRVLQQTEALGLHDGLILKGTLLKLSVLSQQVKGYADRFAEAQNKLRSRVSAEEVPHYRESFAEYGSCELTPDQFEEDDRKSVALRF